MLYESFHPFVGFYPLSRAIACSLLRSVRLNQYAMSARAIGMISNCNQSHKVLWKPVHDQLNLYAAAKNAINSVQLAIILIMLIFSLIFGNNCIISLCIKLVLTS